ncbi:unnamed protein product [Eruca vesicaria subsp. sativa]|uniref:KIB1-4 beta-propeller domain-containing protein n=1 Tax=Eruca vesicaria subsp. sativa TaxID=29727 RepID=A0ABC8KF48_ERUVS|nr:unnamed protein product [Eruca vesicaria subsp. sativa]
MSLILNQLPCKLLCLRRPVLVRCSPPHHSSSASSPQSSQNLPLTIILADPSRPQLVRAVIRRDGDMDALDHEFSSDFMEVTEVIGTSNGWITSLVDGGVRLREHPGRIPKEVRPIFLPPHATLHLCQAQLATNVAMSASSPEKEDCAVAVKFLGPQLSICKGPAQSNAEWIHIRISNPCFFSSHVMYSEKEDMFRIIGSGGHLVGSWNLGKKPKFQRLQFQNLPELSKAKRELLYSCNTSEHLVESRTTGETFMVKWYKRIAKTIYGIERMETKALMVFKIDEQQGNAVYTQDIGDLCIFLSRSESFCVPACLARHMRRNRVKLMDVDEITIIDLAAQKWN